MAGGKSVISHFQKSFVLACSLGVASPVVHSEGADPAAVDPAAVERDSFIRKYIATRQIHEALADGNAGPEDFRKAYTVRMDGEDDPVTVHFEDSEPDHSDFIRDCRAITLGDAYADAVSGVDQKSVLECMARKDDARDATRAKMAIAGGVIGAGIVGSMLIGLRRRF